MSSSRQRGLSLLEVVIFIVVLGIAITGMAILYNQLTLASVDPLVRKQAVAIANSLMEEIQLRPFSAIRTTRWCRRSQPTGLLCARQQESTTIGRKQAKRYADPRFDNVSDYNGQHADSIQDISNNTIAGDGVPRRLPSPK
jgi:MSHA pilin protein MshD